MHVRRVWSHACQQVLSLFAVVCLDCPVLGLLCLLPYPGVVMRVGHANGGHHARTCTASASSFVGGKFSQILQGQPEASRLNVIRGLTAYM